MQFTTSPLLYCVLLANPDYLFLKVLHLKSYLLLIHDIVDSQKPLRATSHYHITPAPIYSFSSLQSAAAYKQLTLHLHALKKLTMDDCHENFIMYVRYKFN